MTTVTRPPDPGRPGAWRPPFARPAVTSLAVTCLAVTGLAAPGVWAQSPVVTFDIPSKPTAAALVDFAVQAKISLGLQAAAACAGPAPALIGRYAVEAGLDRLLTGTGCGYRRLDDRAFDIIAPRRTPRPPAETPTASAPEPKSATAPVTELIVVATQRATRADRLAYAVSSISTEGLQHQGVRDMSDLALVSPAMTITNLGMGRDKVLLRGLSDGPLTGLTQSLVGLYLDDTRLTFNAPDPDLRLVDVDRVEVLRGPQGALYGSGSLTGVVRVVSASPDPLRQAAALAATVGLTNGGLPSHAVDVMLNVPLLAGHAAVRLVGYHELDGGYVRDTLLNIDHANRTQREGVRLTGSLDLDDRWRLTGGALWQDIAAADTQYTERVRGRIMRNVQIAEPHDNDFSAFHLRLAGDLDWGSVRTSLAYIRHSLFSRYDASDSPPAPIPYGPAAFDERDHIESIVADATAISAGAGRFQWLAGAFYAHTWQSSHSILTSLAVPASVRYEELRRDNLDEGALYGQATERLFRGLEVTVGGRLFASGDQVTSVGKASFGSPSTPFTGRVGQAGFAPKIIIAERVAPWLLIYAQTDEGYRGPGINTAAASTETLHDPGGAEPLRVFKGDELWSVEAGGKLTALDGRLRLDVAVFQVEWRNIQSDQLLMSGLPYTANVGHARNLGVEAEGLFRSGALELRAEMLINEPELDKANPAFPILSQNGLGVVPDHTFGASAHYDWRLWDGWSLGLDTRWTYVGVSHLMLNIASLPPMGDYATGRVAATLANDHWRVTLAADNPADVQGNTFAYGNPFTVRYRQQVTPLRPRTITLGVAVNY